MKVAISRAKKPYNEDTIEAAVREAVNNACEGGLTAHGQTVVIKPNVFCPSPPPTTTDPRVVSALVKIAWECGAKRVIVAEGRSISTAKFRSKAGTTKECFEATGMLRAVEMAGAEAVFLEDDEFIEVDLPDAVVLKKAHIPRTILEADVFINAPVMKNHSLALITMGIKNLHGIISDMDKLFGHDYHRLPDKLADILRAKKPDLTVLDGITGEEGDHAELGNPVEMGLIIASKDTVALDTVASAVIGLDPMEVETTVCAAREGLGEADLSKIEIVGESIESARRPFARPDIAVSEAKFPGLRVYAGDYCRGCEYYIRRGLDKLAQSGDIDPERPIAIIFGKEPKVPDDLPSPVLIIGDCAMSSDSVKMLRNRLFLEGRLRIVYTCPPMEFRMRAKELVE